MLIPPIPPSTISSNLNFSNLIQYIQENNLLKDDKDDNDDTITNSSTAVRRELQKYQEKSTRNTILSILLRDLNLDDPELDVDEREKERIYMIATYLSSTSTTIEGTNEIMINDLFQQFKASGYFDKITQSLNKEIITLHDELNEIAQLASYTNTNQERTKNLDEIITSQLRHLQNLSHESLPRSMENVTNTVARSLGLQSKKMELQIQYLERLRFGAVARHEVSRAQFLAFVAEALGLKSRLGYLQSYLKMCGDEGTREKLRARMKGLEDEERTLSERRGRLEDLIWEYDHLNNKGVEVMRTLGKRYKVIEEELEQVKSDVERIEKTKGH